MCLSKASNNIVILFSGVPILHVIATPFPKQWHKSGDNLNTVHFPTVEKLNKIFRLFVAEYLQLPTQLWDEAEDDGVGSDNEPRATIDRKHIPTTSGADKMHTEFWLSPRKTISDVVWMSWISKPWWRHQYMFLQAW